MTFTATREILDVMVEKMELLADAKSIRARIVETAAKIDARLKTDCVENFSAIWVRDGAERFASEILELIKTPHDVCSVKISTYGNSRAPERMPTVVGDIPSPDTDIVMLIDDIFDTGATAHFAREMLRKNGAKKVYTCFLLDKENGLKKPFAPDFSCLKIGNCFVAGYGLDNKGKCRELDGVYKIV